LGKPHIGTDVNSRHFIYKNIVDGATTMCMHWKEVNRHFFGTGKARKGLELSFYQRWVNSYGKDLKKKQIIARAYTF
jgi:hypothetical protein